MDLTFEWDEHKAELNRHKHGVGFYEARTVFGDPFLLTFADPDQSADEERWLSIGRSQRDRILTIAHTDRHASIRIISCRRATATERKAYEQETR